MCTLAMVSLGSLFVVVVAVVLLLLLFFFLFFSFLFFWGGGRVLSFVFLGVYVFPADTPKEVLPDLIWFYNKNSQS